MLRATSLSIADTRLVAASAARSHASLRASRRIEAHSAQKPSTTTRMSAISRLMERFDLAFAASSWFDAGIRCPCPDVKYGENGENPVNPVGVSEMVVDGRLKRGGS